MGFTSYNKTGLCIDVETSGSDPKEHTAVSFGIIAFNVETFEPIDTLYIEVIFDDKYKWSNMAESIHGLSRAHLEQNGLSREDAAFEIGSFILKHCGTDKFLFAGHQCPFDIVFTEQLLFEFGLPFNKHWVVLDSAPMAFTILGFYQSNKVFEAMGFETRSAHNALDDCFFALETIRTFSLVLK